jgi:predicted ribosome-associated RNA-binding protein Tma20
LTWGRNRIHRGRLIILIEWLGSAVLVNSWLMRRRAMQRFDSGVRRAKGALCVSPFDKPKKGRIAVKVINHLGDKVMKVFRV